ncbi:MAG: hypothetical protein F6K35_13115, partial [Okeania sp. SIO2H7]|nr:hypothetical protein [Okeania sp. SIO2H7]
FMFDFGEAVITQFPNYYAIANNGSKTTAQDFASFCDKVGISYDENYPEKNLIDRSKIEACFKVPEPIFDYDILKQILEKQIARQSNVTLHLNTSCNGLSLKNNRFVAQLNDEVREYDIVINAAYANINQVNSYLGIPLKKLLYEDVLIPYFLYPLSRTGLTIMDGDFCSVMPKGINKNEFLLYHVKYSVLNSFLGEINQISQTPISDDLIERLYQKSAEFYPFLREVKHVSFWRTIRAVHENSDDARLSEIFTYPGVDNYYTILSGKVSTCVQVALEIKHKLEGKTLLRRFKV